MGVFGQKEAIFIFKRQGLEVFINGGQKLSLDFSPETVKSEEVIDEEKWLTQMAGFLTENKMKKVRATIVLGDELIFQKNILGASDEEIAREKDQFLSEVPFPSEKILVKTFLDKKIFLAVNGELFGLLKQELEKIGGSVMAVLPLTLLGVQVGDEGSLWRVVHNKKPVSYANLLDGGETKKSFSLRVLMVIVLLLILGGGGWWFYSSKMHKSVEGVAEKTGLPEITEASKSASVNYMAKEDLTIKVLNGSGVVGEAGKVKTSLEGLGYFNIETGNAEEESMVTTVSFGAGVSKADADLIVSELETTLETVEVEDSASEEVDVLVVTGKQ